MLDPCIRKFCGRNRITYTRFADDLLFSSKVSIGKGARENIRDIIRSTGFRVNEDKMCLADTHRTPIEYLGIKIFQGSTSPTDEFMEKYEYDLKPASIIGMIGWEKSVRKIGR
jgi:hypothetical protein